MAFQRIVADHRVMAGVPCIRGTRIPVASLIGLVAEGLTTGEILVDFPQLTADDVREALQFAAADEDSRILITADTDFGTLLALSEALHRGAVITVDTTRIRDSENRQQQPGAVGRLRVATPTTSDYHVVV